MTLHTGSSDQALGRLATTMAFAMALGGVLPNLAYADDDRHEDHSGRNFGHARGHDHRPPHFYHRDYYDGGYRYAEPVYAPAPVYVAPAPSPGISLFFPLDLRR